MAFIVMVSMFILSYDSTDYTRVDSRTAQQKATLRYFFALLGLNNGSSNATHADLNEAYSTLHPGLTHTLTSCYVFITLEIILRMVSCPSLWRYLKFPFHICEILGAL